MSVHVRSKPVLLSIHANERHFKGDHVLVYLIKDFDCADFVANGEIAQIGFFDFESLPEDINPACWRRIQEYRDQAERDPLW